MDILLRIVEVFIVFGGSYAAALATASSFFAVFYFFWTRTGDRKDSVCLDTKKIYLPVIYATLRISLYIVIIAFLAEITAFYLLVSGSGFDISLSSLLLSKQVFFTLVLLVILVTNSTLMIHRKMPFSFGLPLAVVSYFVLFVTQQYTSVYFTIDQFQESAFPGVWIAFVLYAGLLFIGYTVFNHYSAIVRNNLKKK